MAYKLYFSKTRSTKQSPKRLSGVMAHAWNPRSLQPEEVNINPKPAWAT